MWPACHAGAPDGAKLLACCQCPAALENRWRDQPEVAVGADKSVMLDEHLEPAETFALHADEGTGGNGPNRGSADAAGRSTPS